MNDPPKRSIPSGLRHLFVLTDLEGVAGVTHWRQTRSLGPEQEEARGLLTGEVNAFVKGLRDAASRLSIEPPRISIWDGHGTGGLHLEALPPDTDRYRHDDPGGFAGVFEHGRTRVDPPIDALAFVGQHAMEGTGGNLAHTYSSRRVKRHTLNGVEVGEFETRALHAWALGVPTVFFSGDDVACREARALVPDLIVVEVKRSLGVTEADCLSHEESCLALQAGGERLVEVDLDRLDLSPRFQPEPPFVYRQVKKPKWGLVPRPRRTLEGRDLAEVLRRV